MTGQYPSGAVDDTGTPERRAAGTPAQVPSQPTGGQDSAVNRVSIMTGQQDFPARAHFPLFADVRGKKALLIGGGPVAARRLRALCHFAFQLRAVAPAFLPEIEAMAAAGLVALDRRPFQPSDIQGAFLVVAATGDRAVNRQAALLAKEAGAFVSVADRQEESNCYFPGLALGQDLTAAVTGNGHNHQAVKEAAAKIRAVLPPCTKNDEDEAP
jgi:siroheme synthase-like protein